MTISEFNLAIAIVLACATPADRHGRSRQATRQRSKAKTARFATRVGNPTYKVAADGTVDWYTYSGFRRYHSECHVCHGPDGEGSTYAPALERIRSRRWATPTFIGIVAGGKQDLGAGKEKVMPAFGDNKNVICYLDDIYVYLRARSQDAIPRGRPAKHEDKPPRLTPPKPNAWVGGARCARLSLRFLALIGALASLAGPGAQDTDVGGSIELVDPHVFRACADPRNLPFSNEAGEGFENKIAELFARKLGKSVAYTFYPGATGFIRNTLNAHRCDVVTGNRPGRRHRTTNQSPIIERVTPPRIAKDGPLDGLESLSDPRLKTAKIGVVAGTPPVTFLAAKGLLGQIKSYPLVVDTRYDLSSQSMMDDLDSGDNRRGAALGSDSWLLRFEGQSSDERWLRCLRSRTVRIWSIGSRWACGIPTRIGSVLSTN